MEGLLSRTNFAELAASAPELSHFTVVDVGCSGGIDTAWRVFGPKLTAFGFDPNLDECARLQTAEKLTGVR